MTEGHRWLRAGALGIAVLTVAAMAGCTVVETGQARPVALAPGTTAPAAPTAGSAPTPAPWPPTSPP